MTTAFTEISVTGKGPFPLDMLRFMQAWPKSSSDAEAMSIGFDNSDSGWKEARSVTLQTSAQPGPHSLRRWESFGWTVTAWADHSGDKSWMLAERLDREARIRATPMGRALVT